MAKRMSARRIAQQYGCTLQKARQHAAVGTLPGSKRTGRRQRDAAEAVVVAAPVEAAPPDEMTASLLTDIALVRDVFKRLEKAEEFSDDDLDQLRKAAAELSTLLADWEDVVAQAEADDAA